MQTDKESQMTSTEHRLTDNRNNLDGFSGHRQTDKHKNRQPGDFNWAQAYRQEKQPGRILWTQTDRQTQKQTARWLQLSAGLPTKETTWTDSLDTGRQTNTKADRQVTSTERRLTDNRNKLDGCSGHRQTDKPKTDSWLQLSAGLPTTETTWTNSLDTGRETNTKTDRQGTSTERGPVLKFTNNNQGFGGRATYTHRLNTETKTDTAALTNAYRSQ